MARQLVGATELGLAVPNELAVRYAGVITERRTGQIALLPSAAFAPKAVPSDAELATWYGANQKDYVRPESRVLRYAVFDDSALKTVPAPTEAEIAARYNVNQCLFRGDSFFKECARKAACQELDDALSRNLRPKP